MKALSEVHPAIHPDVEGDWAEITVVAARVSVNPFPAGWRPAINAFRCLNHFVVFVDLAGVPPVAIVVKAEPQRLTIRGMRPPAEPGCERTDLAQLLALEIDQGAFERILDLPHEINPADMATEYRDGLFRIQLPLRD
ncbi:MAG: Hsp20/alpha crystallin family protein [Lacunisphaera sp.]